MNLETHNQLTDKQKIEYTDKKRQEDYFKLVSRMILKPGLKLWEFDFKKMELKEAEIIKTTSVSFESKKSIENSKAFFNPNAFYFQSHCKRTAVKKVNKMIYEAIGVAEYFVFNNKQILTNN